MATGVAVTLVLGLLIPTVVAGPSASLSLAPPLPGQLTYQGQLLDKSSGSPVPDAKYDLAFAIYDDPSTGTMIWSQAFTGAQGVQVIGGQFTVILGGAPSPFPSNLFSGEPRWLGVTVGTDAEMTPRTKLVSVPFALRAEALRAGGATSEDMASTLYKFENNDPGGYALVAEGRFHVQGDAHVEGTLSWATRTGYISVPAAAFEPGADTFQYHNNGSNLYTDYGANFFAPVNLPDGSTVTKVTFYYYDDTATDNVAMSLRRYDLGAHLGYIMAETSSSDGGYGDDYDDSISYAQIDNQANTYYLYAAFGTTGSNLKVLTVVIEYEYTKP
jgi:hypothetical protein